MLFRPVLFYNLLQAKEAWRTETFHIILINSIPLHIPRSSIRLGRPTVRISSYFIHLRLTRNRSAIRHFIFAAVQRRIRLRLLKREMANTLLRQMF